MALRVLMVAATFHPAAIFGGPTVFTKELFDSLSTSGDIDIKVLTSNWGIYGSGVDPSGSNSGKVTFAGYRLFRDFSLELLVRLPGMTRRADVVQIHSVFSFTSLAALFVARIFRKPVVLVPHGQLLSYGMSRRRVLKFPWINLVKAICRSSRMVVRAAAADELSSNREVFPNHGHVTIANGLRLPEPSPIKPSNGTRRVMFLGRLYPVKQPEILLRAMCLLPDDVVLDVHGSGAPSYVAALKALSVQLGVSERVVFHGWLDTADQADAFGSADALVVPSRSESFGQVVVEALAHGVPVVASQGTPWAALDAHDCGRWVPARPETVANACMEVFDLDRVALRDRARHWMRDVFSIESIANDFKSIWKNLLKEEQDKNPPIRVVRRPAKVCIVSSCGGHLAEVKALDAAYGGLPHFFVLNDHLAVPPGMAGRTVFIKHSERDAWFLWNLLEMFVILWRERPDIILSTGAGPAVPAAIVGRFFFGCRVIYVETMTRIRAPSLTGRLMYRLAHRFVYQWPGLRRWFPRGIHAGPFE